MNITLLIGGILFCAGLLIASSEGPNCPGMINLIGLGIFGLGCLLISIGGNKLEEKRRQV